MNNSFTINGVHWRLIFVPSGDATLIDRTGKTTLACTDALTKRVYISNELRGDMLKKVVTHELGHCIMISYGMLDYIHKMVKPEYWIEVEEFICNFVADYGGLFIHYLYTLGLK